MMTTDDSRSARKHRAIMEAAEEAFLRNGYLGTSMDEVAKLAAVSKQTVYKHFADKEQLFTEIISSTTDQIVDELVRAATLALQDTADLERDLGALARQLIASISRPKVLRLRRLVIAEAERFPELGQAYWEAGFERGLATLASSLRHLAERGLLQVDDARMAASQFAGLVLWIPLNRVMFRGDDGAAGADLDRIADAGVQTFLAAYGRR
jgi:TetR/AcrR family transcriptional regulator, mexJK operon transcriptional repressor